jgi:hypothetical protein
MRAKLIGLAATVVAALGLAIPTIAQTTMVNCCPFGCCK